MLLAVAFGLSQVVLSLILLARLERRGIGERLFGLLMLANACYLSSPLMAGSGMQAWVYPWATAIPGLFWLFSASIFDDHFRLRFWHTMPVAVTVFFPMLGVALGSPAGFDWFWFTGPQVLEFVFMGLVFWVVAQHWSIDLVESRRRLRIWFVGLNGVGVFMVIFSREVLFPGQAWLNEWQYVPVAMLLLGINAVLLGYRGGVVFDQTSSRSHGVHVPSVAVNVSEAAEIAVEAEVVGEPSAVDSQLVDQVQAYMQAHCAWREMGLTIGLLAQRLEVPQYRLRLAINAGLGYRNFSDFLNSYRIEEAAARLQDPQETSLPVLTIAMDAGFRSLSSFNKAFKDAHGITPTQHRKNA